MSLRKLATAAVAVMSLFAVGCSQVPKGALKESDFAKQYQTRYSVSKKWSQCIAAELYHDRPATQTLPAKPKLTDDERKVFNASKPQKSITASIERKAEVAGATCDAKGLKP